MIGLKKISEDVQEIELNKFAGGAFGISLYVRQLFSHPQTIRLWRLKQIVNNIVSVTGVNWFDTYRKLHNTKNEWVLPKHLRRIFGRHSLATNCKSCL